MEFRLEVDAYVTYVQLQKKVCCLKKECTQKIGMLYYPIKITGILNTHKVKQNI